MAVIEEGEEREAEHVETTDYFFDKIGESVPLSPNNPSFDLQNPPSLPLAVSEQFRLIFVAIDNGFCVAKTSDVINLAKDIKSGRAAASSSVLDVCVVQVLIGRISILSLSTDSSMIAASVGGDIYFFSVESLLHKEKEPHLSLSIESPNRVKYICWTKKKDTSFVVLSNTGTLYSGDLQQPLKQVMDDVDAVDWSIKGEFLAVASKQVLSILTLEFNKRKQILLQFKLGFADADEGSITVDSIQWVRSDCIVVGSLQQPMVGKEENYLVQVITCENGEEITDASSTPVTLCLSDVFLSIVDDIMPFGHGPYLQLSYLETRQLAVLANRKNTDQHIALVGWLEDSEGPAVVHIERDNWLPRIELQENDDDNVILAMCIDRASVYENIKVNLGEDDEKELSPHCIFLCLTHEGKLVIFHFASISGNSGAPITVPVCSDEEIISTTGAPDLPTISVEEKDDKNKQIVSVLESPDMNRDKSAAAEVDEKHPQKNSEQNSSVDVDETLGGECVKQIPPKSFVVDDSKLVIENYNEAEKVKPGGSSSTSDYPVQKDIPFSSSHVDKSKVELDKSSGGVQSGTKETKQFTSKSFAADSPKLDPENFNEAGKPRVGGLRSFSVGKIGFKESQSDESKNSMKLGVIEEGEEREAEHVETIDYFFDKIGESVPLSPSNPSFDLQNPPSLPLAVSERFRLIFVAIDDGFCVAKTADVINLAKDIKSGHAAASSSVLDVCIVQVLIGSISILSLSTDSSMLAASVGGDIYFFSVESLLRKEKEPHLSLSIESPNRVKYICWTKKKDTSFVVLSNTGTLYSGDLQHPLKQVMDDVDAVEWSIRGEFLAVASKQALSILTPEFNKRKQILLQFKLGFADADEGAILVDSIQWVRSDCIVVGSLQQTVAGKEENYLVQVITCENGEEITDASSTPVTLCLSDVFLSIVDDIMPFGHGPYLQLTYLETRQLAVLVNRKNTDQHIALVGWLEDSEGPAVVHIERDNWLPRIELQENDDDNVLLALCIDRASVYENIKVNLGEDDERELSPHCIFLCLTHEGKLVIFHFASISGNSGAPSTVPVCSDEETISTTGAPDLPTISVEEKDDKNKQIVSDLESPDMNRDKSAAAEVDENNLQKNSEPSSSVDVDETLGGECVKQIPPKSFVVDDSKLVIENYNEAEKVKPGGSSSTSDYPVQKDIPFSSSHVDKSKVELDKSSGGVQSGTKETKQFPAKSFAADSPKLDPENSKEAEKPRVEGLRSFSDFSYGKIGSYLSQGDESNNSVKLGLKLGGGQLGNKNLKQIPQKGYAEKTFQIGAENLNKAENLKLTGLTSAFGVAVGKNSLFNSNLSHAEKSKNSADLGNRESSSQATSFRNVLEQGTTNYSGLSSSSGTVAINAGRATPVTANTAMGINSLQGKQSLFPAVSHVPLMNVNLRSPSDLTNSKLESSLLKKYGNIKDMTSELDKLLQSIEEPGGFMDTCCSSQKLLQILEQTVTVLSHKCTTLQSLIHEQGETIQNLLDNTVQVLARRIYMEGIVKQTRDKNYWDLWNRQKLSSELQMRRQSMINLSQDLINQLIELEKHFNALELNKYGESSGVNTGGQSFRRKYPPSRKIQSLHAVHNSLHSQLAAAEQLSDCLSKQMSALSITSSSVKPDNVKDQLFKLIGLPCESHSETSIHTKQSISADRPYVTPSFSPVSSTKGKNLRSNQTGSSNHEPETLRRRRDSFGQNWANFEPSKTTIKRIQRESERSDVKRPSLFMDKRFSIPSSADGSVDAGDATHLDLFHDARVVEDTSKNFTPRGSSKSSRDNNIPEPRVSSINYAFGKQVFSPERSNQERSTSFENQDSGLSKERKTSFTVKTQPSPDQQNVQRAQSLVSPFSKITNSTLMSNNSKDSTSTKRGGGGNIFGQKVSSTLPFSSGSLFGTESSQPAVFSQPAVPINESKTSSNSTTNFSSMVSSVANSAIKSPFSLSSTPSDQKFSFNIAAGTLNSSPGKQNELKSATQPTSLATSSAASSMASSSSSNSIVKPLDQSSWDKVGAAGSNFSDTSSFKPADTILSKPHETSPVSLFTKPTLKTPSKEPPKSEVGWNSVTVTNSSSGISNLELKKTAEVIVFPQAQVSTAQEVEVDEDEMEEEAPSQTANFSLGSFGGLGLGGGSNPNNNTSSPFGSNPFGGPSVSITAPAMDMAVPGGQLFKPASFSIPTPQLQAQSTSGFGTSLGQPAQTGSGLQALGSVLGSFGQSRQLGPTALPAANPGGGFGAATPPAGGFGGGFAGVGPAPAAATATSGFGGGFAGVGATTGGFSAAATAGGFAGAGGGGGFGAFGGGGGGGGFSSFSSGTGAPKELFTQMRK